MPSKRQHTLVNQRANLSNNHSLDPRGSMAQVPSSRGKSSMKLSAHGFCHFGGPFLPGFYGVRSVAGYEVGFMVMDSAYVGMEPPFATLDIKVGKKTWDDHAKPEKIEK
ncbi:unnamed protein product, partial [Prorocentrum cordatum]